MTQHITDFVSRWTFENINVEPYDPGDAVINPLVEKLVGDARDEGISVDDLKAVCGSPRDVVTEALRERTDDEVERRASREE